MGKHQLIINNQTVDVYSENDVLTVVSYMISEISDVQTRRNSTSKTIKLPGTSRNKKIFGFADDLNVADFNGQNVTMLGTIREDGTDILTGSVNLNDVTQVAGEVVFNITIIGNSGEWVEAMKSSRLLGIDLQATHLKTSANIKEYFDPSHPYAYALINNGSFGSEVVITSIDVNQYGLALCMLEGTNVVHNLRTNFAIGDIVVGAKFSDSQYNTQHIIDDIGTTPEGVQFFRLRMLSLGDDAGVLRSIKGNVVIEERPLVLNVRAILIRMFALAGYTISSTFIDSDFFKRVFLLPGSEKHTQDFVTLNATKIGMMGDAYTSGVVYIEPYPFNLGIKNDAGMYSLGTHKFTATEAMHGIFTAQFKIKGSEGYKVWADFRVNNIPVEMNRNTTQLELEEANYQIFSQEAELRLQAGDYVTVGLMIPAVNEDVGHLTVSKDESWFNIAISDKIIKGSTIVPGNFLPDVTQLEFIQAVRHAFNLYFLTDINMKTVYIEPRDSFYKTNKTIDLTGKLDIGREIKFEELGSDFTKTLAFRFKQDSADFGVQAWEKANAARYSTYVATINNKFCNAGETAIENPLFAATLMDAFPRLGLSSILPKIWGEPPAGDTYPERLDKYEPRLLYCAGTRNCLSGETWKYEGTSQSSYLLFCSKDSETVNNNSLLFEQNALDLELYTKHYANYIRTLNEGRKITAYFKLTAADVQALMTVDPSGVNVRDFRSLVYFRHRGEVTNCRLDSVQEYAPGGNKTTKVILITDVDNTFNSQIVAGNFMEFINNNNPIGQYYANGCIRLASYNWSQCEYQAYGNAVYQNTQYGIGSSQGTGAPYSIERAFLYFQTAALPDTCTILEAYLDIYKLGGSYNQEVTLFQGTQADILTINDYSHFGTTPFGSTNAGNLGFRRIRLNAAGLAAINKTGVTRFCLRESYYDVKNIAPTSVNTSFRTYFTGAPQTYINKLTVKYTV